MTTISSPFPMAYTPQPGGVQTPQSSQGTQAAGAVDVSTGVVPVEVGQGASSPTTTAGKPALPVPKASSAPTTDGVTKTEDKDVGTARQRADAKLDRAAQLREMRKDRREAVCAKAFGWDDFARLVTGPVIYCFINPVPALVGALAIGAAIGTALSTGSLAGFKAAMPAISPMIAGLVKSSGLNEMVQRGAELALLTLGVDPKVTEKWGDTIGSAAFVGANVVMNAVGGSWEKIDFSLVGDFAKDAAVLLNVPAKNAAALGNIVDMMGTAVMGIGVGIAKGDYKELKFENFKTIWSSMEENFKAEDYKFKLTDVTNLDAFKGLASAWGELSQDFGNFQEFIDSLNDLTATGKKNSAYTA